MLSKPAGASVGDCLSSAPVFAAIKQVAIAETSKSTLCKSRWFGLVFSSFVSIVCLLPEFNRSRQDGPTTQRFHALLERRKERTKAIIREKRQVERSFH